MQRKKDEYLQLKKDKGAFVPSVEMEGSKVTILRQRSDEFQLTVVACTKITKDFSLRYSILLYYVKSVVNLKNLFWISRRKYYRSDSMQSRYIVTYESIGKSFLVVIFLEFTLAMPKIKKANLFARVESRNMTWLDLGISNIPKITDYISPIVYKTFLFVLPNAKSLRLFCTWGSEEPRMTF